MSNGELSSKPCLITRGYSRKLPRQKGKWWFFSGKSQGLMVKPLIDCGFEGPQNHPIHWEMLIGNPMLRRYPKSEKHLQLIITTAITYSSELAGCSTASRFDLKREDSADETETEDEALMKTCAGGFRVFVFFWVEIWSNSSMFQIKKSFVSHGACEARNQCHMDHPGSPDIHGSRWNPCEVNGFSGSDSEESK